MIGYLKVIRSLFERRLWQDIQKSFAYPLWIIYEEYVKDFEGFWNVVFAEKIQYLDIFRLHYFENMNRVAFWCI